MVVTKTQRAILIPQHGAFAPLEAVPSDPTMALSNQGSPPTSSESGGFDADYNSLRNLRGLKEG